MEDYGPQTASPLQIPRRPSNFGQMIPVQRLHHFPQPLMAIILLIPHILMILHLPLFIQRQTHKTVYRFGEMRDARGVFLFHFEDDFICGVLGGGGGGDDFGGEGAGGGHDFGYACVEGRRSVWVIWRRC